jgi:hypothetical protein
VAVLELDIGAQLIASLDSVAAELREYNKHQRSLAARAAAQWPVRGPALSLSGTGPWMIGSNNNGPSTGYAWQVQRITIGPSGAATDLVTVYRGYSSADVVPQNAIDSVIYTGAGQFGTIRLGYDGIILMPDESIIVSGTITGTNPMLNWDVDQVETWRLSRAIQG